MTSEFATAFFRALAALGCCLGMVIAPVVAVSGCGAREVDAKCACCADAGGCCSSGEDVPAAPLTVPPVKTSLRDVAPAPVAVVAALPPAARFDFPNVLRSAVIFPSRIARHSLLCIRTV